LSYFNLNNILLNGFQDDRPDTAMSGESFAPSEAPSLGSSIKRVASAQRFVLLYQNLLQYSARRLM
jgi:hypothetical protein